MTPARFSTRRQIAKDQREVRSTSLHPRSQNAAHLLSTTQHLPTPPFGPLPKWMPLDDGPRPSGAQPCPREGYKKPKLDVRIKAGHTEGLQRALSRLLIGRDKRPRGLNRLEHRPPHTGQNLVTFSEVTMT